jgi:hypothetical protein
MGTKRKIKPADCKDMYTASLLESQGIGHNDDSITVEPGVVVLKMGHTTMRIPMKRFRMFAEWYLEEQEVEGLPAEPNYDTSTKS